MNGVPYAAAIGPDIVQGFSNSPPYTYSLSGLSSATAAVISSAGKEGGDGDWPMLFGSNPVTATSLNLAVDEDQLADSERNHITEQVAYIVFE